MGTSSDKATVFEPAKIQKLDLERPVTRNQRVLPDAEIKRLRGERLEQELSWSLMGPRMQRRIKLNVIGAVLVLPVVIWFFFPVPFSLLHLPLYALYGLYIGYTRPMRANATLATFVLMVALVVASGGRHGFHAFNVFFSVLIIVCIGAAIGISEESKLSI